MDQKPEMIMVDQKTFAELGDAVKNLAEYNDWLASRHIDASRKLTPILSRMNCLLVTILEGHDPTIGLVTNVIGRFFNGYRERITSSKSPQEGEAILREMDSLAAQLQSAVYACFSKKDDRTL
jgi:hypothetical protein